MPKTVVGMFDTFSEAQNAVQDLVRFGVRREDISLLARDEHGIMGHAREVGGSDAAEGAGAIGGSVVGGALGLLIGTGLLVIPGIGPVLAAGPLAAAVGSAAATLGATAIGAGLGAAAGGLLGSLMGAGIPEDDAHAYVEGVRRGGTLVSVNAADNESDDVRQLMIRNGAVDMDIRAAEWRSSGWDTRDTDANAAGDVSLGDEAGLGGAERNAAAAEESTTAGAHLLASDADTISERTRRAPHFIGDDTMGGAISDARIYDRADRQADLDTARAGHNDAIPASGDFARGMREEVAPAVGPDYPHGIHDGETAIDRGAASQANTRPADGDPGAPHHGDYARGMRNDAEPVQPDYARGQRGYELYDTDFLSHYQSLTGSGGHPYDYYKPGYQFGFDLANDRSYSHDTWEAAERDARPRWEREARGSWEEFKQTIRYGWEKARGRA